MRRTFTFIFCAILIAGTAQAQDLQSVIEKTSDALGLTARKSMSGLETSGYALMSGSEAKIPFKLIQSRPYNLRIETYVFGFKAVQTYDGVTAWQLSPTQGMEAVKSDPRDLDFIAAATALDGPFTTKNNDRFTLKYLGKDQYMDKEADVISWSAPEERLKYYINLQTGLVDGVRYEYKKNGGWHSMEYRIKSYAEHEGGKFPESVSAVINGVEMISLHVDKFKSLTEVDPDRFGKPSY